MKFGNLLYTVTHSNCISCIAFTIFWWLKEIIKCHFKQKSAPNLLNFTTFSSTIFQLLLIEKWPSKACTSLFTIFVPIELGYNNFCDSYKWIDNWCLQRWNNKSESNDSQIRVNILKRSLKCKQLTPWKVHLQVWYSGDRQCHYFLQTKEKTNTFHCTFIIEILFCALKINQLQI